MVGRAVLPNPEPAAQPGLFVRLRLQGSSTYEALLVPDEAVGTDQGQRFVWVIDETAARRYRRVESRPHARGPAIIRRGFEPGESVIVAGMQRVRPGIRVEIEETRAGGRERVASVSRFFIDRPIFAAVLSIVIVILGAHRLRRRCRSRSTPTSCRRRSSCAPPIPARRRRSSPTPSPRPIEQEVNGVEDMLYMSSQSTTDGADGAHHHVPARHRSRQGAGARAEPRRDRRAAAAGGSAPPRRHDAQERRPTS